MTDEHDEHEHWEVAVGDDGSIYEKITSETMTLEAEPAGDGIDFVDRSQQRMAGIAIFSMLLLGATAIILALRV